MPKKSVHAVIHRPKPVLIVLLSFLSILLLLFLTRGWFRGTVMPAFTRQFYTNSIRTSFREDFAQPNEWLRDYELSAGNSIDSAQASCHDPYYESFSWSQYCYIAAFTPYIYPNEAYRQRWRDESRDLENRLLSAGWTKEWNAQQPIDEILDYHEDRMSIGVNYSKLHGDVACRISLMFNPGVSASHPEDQGRFESWMTCHRNIDFFRANIDYLIGHR